MINSNKNVDPDNNIKPDNDEQKPHNNNDDLSGLPVLRPKVAGIDIASEIHWVCGRKS